ncbi:hypothetical protein LCGC14_1314030 [marine sediment metagenome]|uniref:Uncharacterized protein n=1 Tax=marine sediment metagenome TaxID=412755 RepID=A0A0F9KM08_9ZZZZ
MIPTQEQIKEVWVWCGFTRTTMGHDLVWMYENKYPPVQLPPLDLNNLFKYAVPKLIGDYKYTLLLRTDVDFHTRESTYTFSLSDDPLTINSEATDKNPALALFWAIQKVIKYYGAC